MSADTAYRNLEKCRIKNPKQMDKKKKKLCEILPDATKETLLFFV